MIDKIIIIQKHIRGYLTRKKVSISSYYQTKNWRKNRDWYKNGKSNECEKYQILLINKIIKIELNKTYDRINTETYEIIENRIPMMKDDGYEWTENFDGKLIKNKNTFYFNLKFVCDNGGAQTRTLRNVYDFIKHQIKYISKFNTNNIYFINILDGDTSYNNIGKFKYLINKQPKNIIKYIFVGSLYDFEIINQNFLKYIEL
jgi:hypothetical protein